MIDSFKLSNIGFGAYRINSKNPGHKNALKLAIDSGCNLVETASTYQEGESENLIGEVVGENDKVFIITKAGYMPVNETKTLRLKSNKNIKISDKYFHSIAPEFLKSRLDLSSKRLKRSVIDCFLIHNPEYHLESAKKIDFYSMLAESLEFLENCVKIGRIRCYGISSNYISSLDEEGYINFEKVLQIANSVNVNHHFKMLEFPYNLFEKKASDCKNNENSLIQLAKSSNVKTLSNRPFNSNYNSQAIQLTEKQVDSITTEQIQLNFEELVELISIELNIQDYSGGPEQFNIIQTLKNNLFRIADIKTVNNLFDNHLLSFLNTLFDDKIPNHVKEVFSRLKICLLNQAQVNLNQILNNMRTTSFFESTTLNTCKDLTFQELLIESYLKSEIDHILVGMRDIKYVNQLKKYF